MLQFVNRQFVPETTYSSSDKDQMDEWSVEAQVSSDKSIIFSVTSKCFSALLYFLVFLSRVSFEQLNSLQNPSPAQLAPEPTLTVNQAAPSPATDPVVRKQAVQDLMAKMQGTYNFMQVKRICKYKDVFHRNVWLL